MSMLMRVNGAWLRLLTDWLDREGLAAELETRRDFHVLSFLL